MPNCKKCGKFFEKSTSIPGHSSRCGKTPDYEKMKKMWNSSKSNTSTYNCDICGNEFMGKQSYAGHRSHCSPKSNFSQYRFTAEDHKKAGKTLSKRIKDGEIIPSFTGKTHSESTKEKIRMKRFLFLKTKSGETAWERRSTGKMSFGEEWLHDIFIKHDIYSKFDVVNEYAIYPYFIDFAFVNEKVAVEFDGKFHLSDERILHDKKRDDYLAKRGWKVFRIIYNEIDLFNIEELMKFIGDPILKKREPVLLKNSAILIEKSNLEKESKNIAIEEKISRQLKDIENVDFSKKGWYGILMKIWNCSHTHVNRTLKRIAPEIYKSAYHTMKRK